MCTDFTKGSKDKGKTNKASCNALLQAAGFIDVETVQDLEGRDRVTLGRTAD